MATHSNARKEATGASTPRGHRWARRIATTAALVAAGSLALSGCGLAADLNNGGGDDKPFYQGQKLRILVPFAPGGGADISARALAPFLEENIPGHPTVYVENAASTAGVAGVNEYAADKNHDGLTLLITSASVNSAYTLKDPGIHFDLNDFEPLIGMANGAMLYARTDTGVKAPEDIFGPTEKPLIVAAQTPTSHSLRWNVALDLLGVDYDATFGYEGTGDAQLAVERGEASMGSATALVYANQIKAGVDAGTFVPIMTSGLLKDGELVKVPSLPQDLMTPMELYEAQNGKPATGAGWDAYKTLVASNDSLSKMLFIYNDAPEEAIAALHEGFDKLLADKDARAALDDAVFGGENPLIGDDLDAAIDLIANPQPEAMAWLKDYLKTRWNVEL